MWIALVSIVVLSALFGMVAELLQRRLTAKQSESVQQTFIEEVNTLLPQLQCGKCNYPGCRPYAEAIVNQHERIDLCPPGGAETVQKLVDFLQVEPPDSLSFEVNPKNKIAIIDPTTCIGCTLCQPVCPTDAIAGSARHLHVVVEEQCVGCELCLEPCPVDCIQILPISAVSDSAQLAESHV